MNYNFGEYAWSMQEATIEYAGATGNYVRQMAALTKDTIEQAVEFVQENTEISGLGEAAEQI